MSVKEDKRDRLAVAYRKTYFRSASWTERSPTKPVSNPKSQTNGSKARSCLPPLQPLSITPRNVEEWPKAGSDDLGIWPHPQTPRGPIQTLGNSNSDNTVREFEFKRDKLAFFDKECSRIADHIYLGSDAVAKNREILRKHGITHVLNCVGFVCPEYFKIDLVYKTLWLQDSPSEDITSILYDVFDYFEDVREQGGRVLVHCCQGVSRSTSLVIAYLMWRKGQSFEDAFQYVKAARGVTNPNMGFACQLLQCQKRVHAMPASPNSMLRMYRMAPHSSYDPLHLVPKMINRPDENALDSRGVFVVHVPSAIYVWNGRNCNSVLSNNAMAAAYQVIRYERAKGPIVNIKEGEEPIQFWDALAKGQISTDEFDMEVTKEKASSSGSVKVGERKVDEYNRDFELFHKALAGGIVPPFSVSNAGSETSLPARENGWSRLRRKFAIGLMKELVTSSKLVCDITRSCDVSDMIIDTHMEEERPGSLVDPSPLSPSTQLCGSPDSFECFPHSSPNRIKDSFEQVEQNVPFNHTSSSSTPCGSPDSFSCFLDGSFKFSSKSSTLSPSTTSDYASSFTFSSSSTPCGSPDSFSCFLDGSFKFSSKSSTLSPSTTSDYASSFTFSPSSSNWSDWSYLSTQQPSPSGIGSIDPPSVRNTSLEDNSNTLNKEITLSSSKPCQDTCDTLRAAYICKPCKGISPSIAERRGSNPPPRMLLPSFDESAQVPRTLVRSNVDSNAMKDCSYSQSDTAGYKEEVLLETNLFDDGSEMISETANEINPVLYEWPFLNEIKRHSFNTLDSRSTYILLVPGVSFSLNSPAIVFIWLGREFQNEKGQYHNNKRDKGDICLEAIGQGLLKQMHLPLSTPFQMIREGEEPEQFLNHLSCLLLQKTQVIGHS